MAQPRNTQQVVLDLAVTQPNDSLLIGEEESLFAAIERLENCPTGFTIFGTDAEQRVTGVLTRGDVLRCIRGHHRAGGTTIDELTVRHAMTPMPSATGEPGMLYIEERGNLTWYEQLSDIRRRIRETDRLGWHRITLIPVLDRQKRLVNVLDLESPRTRARLETLVMAKTFEVKHPEKMISDAALARRRTEFDEIHHGSHRRKLVALCELLLKDGGNTSMLGAIFNAARGDEVFWSLGNSKEWLQSHVSTADMKKEDQKELVKRIDQARAGIRNRYLRRGSPDVKRWFPETADPAILENPEVVVVLGCEGQDSLSARARAAVDVISRMACGTTTMVLSGGGFGHEISEARRMLVEIFKECHEQDVGASLDPPIPAAFEQQALPYNQLVRETQQQGREGWFTLRTFDKTINVVLEEDSMDTLGNAVFSWFTLKLADHKPGLRAIDEPKLRRLVLVTDAIHAPRSHDVFHRVFAFRSSRPGREEGPEIIVHTADLPTLTEPQINQALSNLESESKTNMEIFRLLNPLTNEFDVIENGHVRSILGQMIRLHVYYKGRWDLVRKYRICWIEEQSPPGGPGSTPSQLQRGGSRSP